MGIVVPNVAASSRWRAWKSSCIPARVALPWGARHRRCSGQSHQPDRGSRSGSMTVRDVCPIIVGGTRRPFPSHLSAFLLRAHASGGGSRVQALLGAGPPRDATEPRVQVLLRRVVCLTHASSEVRYRNPAHVGTYGMSATHSWSAPGAPKSRSTRSGAGRASRSRLVVHARPRREISWIPISRAILALSGTSSIHLVEELE